LVLGLKRKWREVTNGAATLTAVGVFIFIAAIVAYISETTL